MRCWYWYCIGRAPQEGILFGFRIIGHYRLPGAG
jgi:hypothetical protein